MYSTRFSLDGMNYLKEGHELYEEIKRGFNFHPAYLLWGKSTNKSLIDRSRLDLVSHPQWGSKRATQYSLLFGCLFVFSYAI